MRECAAARTAEPFAAATKRIFNVLVDACEDPLGLNLTFSL
jgi:hypothetical protein